MSGATLMTRLEFDHFQRVGRVLAREERRAVCKDNVKVAFIVKSGAGYYMGANDPMCIGVTSDPLCARRFETFGEALDTVRFMGGAGFSAEIVEVKLVPYATKENVDSP